MPDTIIGTIALFPNPRDMNGWLRCDGRALHAGDHKTFYFALGEPPREQPGDVFRLPNLPDPVPHVRYVVAHEGRYVPFGEERPRFVPEIVGMLAPWEGEPPATCLLAEGQTMQVNGNEALYSIVQNQFGGDGTTFRLPDLRPKGRHVICVAGWFPPFP